MGKGIKPYTWTSHTLSKEQVALELPVLRACAYIIYGYTVRFNIIFTTILRNRHCYLSFMNLAIQAHSSELHFPHFKSGPCAIYHLKNFFFF